MSTVTEFRAVRRASGTVDTDLYDVNPLREAFNRFDSGVSALFTDDDGTKLDSYPYGQRVEIQYTTAGTLRIASGESYTVASTATEEVGLVQNAGTLKVAGTLQVTGFNERFEGWVADATRTERDGVPAVEVNILGFDHLLRRTTVEKDYSSQTISAILQDLIETFTAISWVGGNVSVQNDKTVDLPLRGVRLDQAISLLASESANEEFGVNTSLEFFFRQQSTNRAAPVGDTEVIRYNLPTEGQRSINRYELYYGASLNNKVRVDDREQQQDLKDKFGTSSGVVIADSDAMPEVTTEDRAEAIARERLGEQSVIQTGTITVPLGRFTASAGDVIDVTISEAGITNTDFRIAQIDYLWQEGVVEMIVAENVGDISDLLVGLSDGLQNVRMRDADPSATEVVFLDVRSGVTVSISATLTTKTYGDGFIVGQSQVGEGTSDTVGGPISSTASVSVETKKATVALLNLIRDLWQDGNSAFVDLTHIAVGTDDSAATKADTGLQTEVASRVDIEKFGAGGNAEEFEFTATVPAGGAFADAADLAEVSIADAASAGNHYARLTFADTTINATTRLKIHVEFTIDVDTEQQGVITSKGQERIRDLIIGESNHEPSDLVYGEGTTAAVEGDTALGSKQHEDTIDDTNDLDPGACELVERTTDMEADTSDWSEIGAENAANELLQRIVFDALASDVVLEAKLAMQAVNA